MGGLILSMLVALAGCQTPDRAIFSAGAAARVWPAAPDAPRIAYVGELTGEDSLHARRDGFEALGEILTGPRPKARFVTPMAVAVAGERVYVADPAGDASVVHVLDMKQRTYAAIREVTGTPLQWPVDLAVCDNRLAIADADRATVFLVDLNGAGGRAITGNGLTRPVSLAWDARANQLFVADAGAGAVFVFDANGRFVRRFGTVGAGEGEFHAPVGIAVDARDGAARVVVADSLNFRAQLLSADGASLRCIGSKGDAAGSFALPRDVAVDRDGNLYVLDNQLECVQVFDQQGQLLMALGQEGRAAGEFWLPSGITIDDQDRIWIADTYNRRVQVFRYLPQEAAP
ncbi:MAG: 6-bladed beta-propeller [Phycisphaerales bacterium]|nr:6-bladed beta-propeller [Phycisphaerales bacterium]